MNAYKAIIFDLDGTLADTIGDLTDAMNKMLVSFGWPTKTTEQITSYANKGAREFVRQALPTDVYKSVDDKIIDTALAVYARKYAEAYCNKTAPYAGLPAQIKALKDAGYKLAVLSNKDDSFVKNIIAKLYPGMFDIVAGHSNLPHKPDPAAAVDIAARLGVEAKKCIFVGDSDVDMNTANNAKMYPLGVLWGYRGLDVLVSAGAKSFVSTPDVLADKISELGKKSGGFFAKILGRK